MPCIHAGPSSIAAVVGAGSVASSELSVEEQQKAEQHAVHAFTYENVFSQVSLLANTQVIDYRCFAFLELASDTSATHPLSMVLRSSNILDSVAQSYSSCKDSCLPPPLAAVTTAAFSQLWRTGSPSTLQQFFMELRCVQAFPTEFDVFHTQALAYKNNTRIHCILWVASPDLAMYLVQSYRRQGMGWHTINGYRSMLCSLSTAYSHNHDHLRHRVSIGTIHFHKGHPFQAYKQVPGASQPSTPNTTSTKGKFTSDVVVKRMPSYDSTHAVTMCRSAPLLPTVQVWCHCGHTTCTEHVCNNQPGLTNSRCPCPCNALYTCLTCQNHLGSAARLPCTETMATLSNATLHNSSFSPSKSNQMLPQQGSAKQS